MVGEEEAGELAPLVTALAGATARWRSQTSSVLGTSTTPQTPPSPHPPPPPGPTY